MNFMELFDVMIAAFGGYVIFTSLRMHQTGEISSIVMNKDDISKCRDKKGFIDYIYKKTIIFGVVAVVFGLFGMYNDMVQSFGPVANWAGIIVFLAMWIWFTSVLRKGRQMFF